jgi:hypothetical protein
MLSVSLHPKVITLSGFHCSKVCICVTECRCLHLMLVSGPFYLYLRCSKYQTSFMLHCKGSYKYNVCFWVFGIRVFKQHGNLWLHLMLVAGPLYLYCRLFTKHFRMHDKSSYKCYVCFYVLGIWVFVEHENLCLHLMLVPGPFYLYLRCSK